MNRALFVLVAFMATWSQTIFAQQVVTGSVPTTLDTAGVDDGVAFVGQGVVGSTLTVGTTGQSLNGENINNNNNITGVSSDSPNASTIKFLGNSGTSIVNGTVGAMNALSSIQGGAGSATILFNGVTSTATFTVTGNGTLQFNNNTSGALTFQNDGFLIIGPGVAFNGAINNLAVSTGTLTLNNASVVNGMVGAAVGALKQVNVVGGNATISLALSATNFSLGTNTLFQRGPLTLGSLTPPVNATIDSTVISDALFGNINAAGENDTISAPVVTINVDATQAMLLTGVPLAIVTSSSGSSGVPIIVTSNSIRYSFIGNNVNGNITIIPTFIPLSQLVTDPAALAVGSILDALLPVAAANPGSDLAFVETQLFALPTAAALNNALLQISPASGLVGVNQESFNTTKEFQKVWLRHFQVNRSYCLYESMDECCNMNEYSYPCGNACEGPLLWADGFGYYGHQDNKDHLNGYKATTWGTMLGFEMPVLCCLRAGLGAGYAKTDLDERKFGNKTDINNYQGTVYLSYNTTHWFADGGFSFGWNRYDGTRHISFPGIDRTAHAKYNGQEYTGFVTGGYQYYYNCFEITPFASLLYSHLHIDDYTEKGANSLDLHVGKQNYNFLESGLGLEFARLFKTRCGIYIPELHGIWFHDFYREPLKVDASFTGLGATAGSFKNKGPGRDRNTWNIGGGITYLSDVNFSIQAIYDYERSSSYFDHQGTLVLSYCF